MPTSRFVKAAIPSDRIAVTLGDPAGIGPEVTVRAIALIPKFLKRRLLLLGPTNLYQAIARRIGLSISFIPVSHPDSLCSGNGVACFFDEAFPKRIPYGRSVATLTRRAVHSIETAVSLALSDCVGAMVTAPINKAGLQKAGFDIPGHTEYLAQLSGTKRFGMMLVAGPLRVALVTRHIPLKKVPQAINRHEILKLLELTDLELRRSFGIRTPRIAVCSLNPHGGEEGYLGKEESSLIGPVLREARKRFSNLQGPYAPDALFRAAYHGAYDAEICMYHDQGLIPLKMISEGSGVNFTLGLPFVRTSPDHGTAYDIAGRWKADARSMAQAIRMAAFILANRRRLSRYVR